VNPAGETSDTVATVDPGRGRILAIIGVALFAVSAGWVVALWFQLGVAVVRPESSLPVGRDFAVFYTGAALAEGGEWHSLYDVAEFQREYDRVTALDSPVGGPVFRYPPPTALVLVPLARVSLKTALVVWTALTVAGCLIALRAARVGLPVAAAMMLTVPGFLTIALGQNTLVTLLVVCAALVLLDRGRLVAAGVVLGLLVLKPQLLIGVVVWLAAAPRRSRRELAGVVVGAGGIVAASLPFTLDGWREYLGALSSLSQPPNTVGRPYFSGLDFLRFLFGDGRLAVVAWVVLVCVVIWVLVRTVRSSVQNPAVGLAVAVLGSLLLSPHLVSYDWLLLVVPGVVLWRRFSSVRPVLVLSAGVLSVAALITPSIVSAMIEDFGWAFSPAFPLLLVLAVLVLRMVGSPQALPNSPGQHVA
jgi:hypothetical protein